MPAAMNPTAYGAIGLRELLRGPIPVRVLVPLLKSNSLAENTCLYKACKRTLYHKVGWRHTINFGDGIAPMIDAMADDANGDSDVTGVDSNGQ